MASANLLAQAASLGDAQGVGVLANSMALGADTAAKRQNMQYAQEDRARKNELLSAFPDAIKGDPNALATVAKNDPQTYMGLQDYQMKRQEQERQMFLQRAQRFAGAALYGLDTIEKAPAEQRQQVYGDVVQRVAAVDPEAFQAFGGAPAQYDPNWAKQARVRMLPYALGDKFNDFIAKQQEPTKFNAPTAGIDPKTGKPAFRQFSDTGESRPVTDLAPTQKDLGVNFTDRMGALMGALAERGVSLPAGFRSMQQQRALLQGILDRNQDKTPDEIASLVKTGQIEFSAQKKETTTAAGVAGKVEVAQNELEEFIPLVREASAKVPRGNFMPINQLMQTANEKISDPNLRALKVRINSVLNAYDMLAARGGTDQEKRREVRGLLMTADGPQALEAALSSFELEAAAAHRAAVKATKVPELHDQQQGDDPLGLRGQ